MADPDLIHMLVEHMEVVAVDQDPPQLVTVHLETHASHFWSFPPTTTMFEIKTLLQAEGHLTLHPFEYQMIDTLGTRHLDRVTIEEISTQLAEKSQHLSWRELFQTSNRLELWVKP